MSEKPNITLSFDFKLNWPNLSFQWYLDRKCSHKWVIKNYQRYVAIWPHATFYSLRKQSAWIVYLAPFQANITVLIWGSIIISRQIIKVLCPSNLKPNPSSLDFFFIFEDSLFDRFYTQPNLSETFNRGSPAFLVCSFPFQQTSEIRRFCTNLNGYLCSFEFVTALHSCEEDFCLKIVLLFKSITDSQDDFCLNRQTDWLNMYSRNASDAICGWVGTPW